MVGSALEFTVCERYILAPVAPRLLVILQNYMLYWQNGRTQFVRFSAPLSALEYRIRHTFVDDIFVYLPKQVFWDAIANVRDWHMICVFGVAWIGS